MQFCIVLFLCPKEGETVNFKYDIKFEDNAPQLHEALEDWVERVLTIWGMKIVDYATQLVPVGTADSTGIEGYVGGALKQSLTYITDAASKTVTVGSALLYALYVELGTGIFAEKGDGRKTPWVWKDQNGKYHFTRGMKPQPFLRPAITGHLDEFKEIAITEAEDS